MFKVGDLVIPKTAVEMLREGWRVDEYGDFYQVPCAYVNEMCREYGGRVCTIVEVFDNGSYFFIREDDQRFAWSSDMVKPYTSDKNNNIKLFVEDDKGD